MMGDAQNGQQNVAGVPAGQQNAADQNVDENAVFTEQELRGLALWPLGEEDIKNIRHATEKARRHVLEAVTSVITVTTEMDNGGVLRQCPKPFGASVEAPEQEQLDRDLKEIYHRANREASEAVKKAREAAVTRAKANLANAGDTVIAEVMKKLERGKVLDRALYGTIDLTALRSGYKKKLAPDVRKWITKVDQNFQISVGKKEEKKDKKREAEATAQKSKLQKIDDLKAAVAPAAQKSDSEKVADFDLAQKAVGSMFGKMRITTESKGKKGSSKGEKGSSKGTSKGKGKGKKGAKNGGKAKGSPKAKGGRGAASGPTKAIKKPKTASKQKGRGKGHGYQRR